MRSNRYQSTSQRVLALATVLAMGLGSCATIVKGKTEKVDFHSTPAGATVTVNDSDGKQMMQGVTPCSFELKRGAGWFKKATYGVLFELEGYNSHQVDLFGRVNGWFIGGNLVFGGIIGWLIVDPATGAMWTMAKKPVEVELTAATPTP